MLAILIMVSETVFGDLSPTPANGKVPKEYSSKLFFLYGSKKLLYCITLKHLQSNKINIYLITFMGFNFNRKFI